MTLRPKLQIAAKGLLPIDAPIGDPGELRLAAVLVALCVPEHGAQSLDELALVLIERAHSLTHHAGQIAFPGGKRDSSDPTLLHTALREAQEEIGLAPDQVEILGRLSPVATPSGFWVVPFVGWLDGLRPWTLHAHEVARLLLAPLGQLRDPTRWREDGTRRFRGEEIILHRYQPADVDWGTSELWGASARMTRELLVRMSLV